MPSLSTPPGWAGAIFLWDVGLKAHGLPPLARVVLVGLRHRGLRGMTNRKDPAAVALGRKGGQKKVPKGVAVLSEEERWQRARQAAQARWGKKKKSKGTGS